MQGSVLIPPASICSEVLRFRGPINVLLHLLSGGTERVFVLFQLEGQ